MHKRHRLQLQNERLYRQSGLTVSLSNPVIAAAQTVSQMASKRSPH